MLTWELLLSQRPGLTVPFPVRRSIITEVGERGRCEPGPLEGNSINDSVGCRSSWWMDGDGKRKVLVRDSLGWDGSVRLFLLYKCSEYSFHHFAFSFWIGVAMILEAILERAGCPAAGMFRGKFDLISPLHRCCHCRTRILIISTHGARGPCSIAIILGI